MKRVIAIGGGEIKDGDTTSIDKHILEVTGKSKPKLLFLPTASGDAEGYWQTIQSIFGAELGAETSVLMLTKEPSDNEVKEKIEAADAIYVGGGNTKRMLELWKQRGVDKLLREAYEQSTVLSGLSAGAICWFQYGSTDAPRFDNPEDTEFVLIEGLNLVSGLVSPHHVREPRRIEVLPKLVRETGSIGFGIDDNAALEIVDGTYRVIASKPDVGITKVYLDANNAVKQEQLLPSESFKPYQEMFNLR